MSYVHNITVLAKYIPYEEQIALSETMWFRGTQPRKLNLRDVHKEAGGGKVYEAELWSTAQSHLNDRTETLKSIRDVLQHARDVYIYWQAEDCFSEMWYRKTPDLPWKCLVAGGDLDD